VARRRRSRGASCSPPRACALCAGSSLARGRTILDPPIYPCVRPSGRRAACGCSGCCQQTSRSRRARSSGASVAGIWPAHGLGCRGRHSSLRRRASASSPCARALLGGRPSERTRRFSGSSSNRGRWRTCADSRTGLALSGLSVAEPSVASHRRCC